APIPPAAPSTPALMPQPPRRGVDAAGSRDDQPGRRALAPPPASYFRGPANPPSDTAAYVQPGEGPEVPIDDRIRIDVGPIAREVFQQFVPEGTNPGTLSQDQRQRIAAEINQRMLGINEGLKLAAQELQKKAEAARQQAQTQAQAKAEAAKAKAPAPVPAPAMKRRV